MSPTPERIYNDHAQALFSFLLNLTRNDADTRDTLQEVFRKLVEKPALLDGVRDQRRFLLRLAHNLAIDQARRRITRQKNHADLVGESAAAATPFAQSPHPDEGHLRDAMSEAFTALPAEQRMVAHLKLWEGATFDEIGKILGISPNTAASRYRYALDKLRLQLRPLYDEIK